MNHHAIQAGPAAQPASAAGPAHPTLYDAHGRELAELLDHVLAGDLASSDRVVVERQIVRVLGALMWLQQRHRVNEHGNCPTCRSPHRAWWRPWPQRTTCTVHTALSLHLRQPDLLALATTAEVTS